MLEDWPFDDLPDTVVIVLGRILRGEASLRLVTHDEDDGSWQFLDGEHVFEDDAAVVLLGEMAQYDPTILALADLPVGWQAHREAPDGHWVRTPTPA